MALSKTPAFLCLLTLSFIAQVHCGKYGATGSYPAPATQPMTAQTTRQTTAGPVSTSSAPTTTSTSTSAPRTTTVQSAATTGAPTTTTTEIVIEPSSSTTSAPVTTAASELTSTSSAPANQTTSAALVCGEPGVECLGIPFECDPLQAANCDVLTKVKSLDDESVQVDIVAVQKQFSLELNIDTRRYFAMGFSKSGGMGEAAVPLCFKDDAGTQARMSYNEAGFNTGYVGIEQQGYTVLSAISDEQSIQCSMKLAKRFTLQGSALGGDTHDFDLSQPTTLILATGSRNPNTQGIRIHDKAPRADERTVAF